MKKWHEFLCKSEMSIAKYTLAILSILVFVAAVARTVHHPIVWAVDMATFLFSWCVFLGGDIALRDDRLFCIVFLAEKLSQKAQLYLKAVNYIIICVFLIGMIGYGSWLTYTTKLRTFQGIPGFSYSWVTLSIPVGCILMLITVIRKIREIFKAIKKGTTMHKDTSITEVI